MSDCYHCGADDHMARDCPTPGKLPIPLRVVRDPAIARTWAQVIRDTLGFPPPRDQGENAP